MSNRAKFSIILISLICVGCGVKPPSPDLFVSPVYHYTLPVIFRPQANIPQGNAEWAGKGCVACTCDQLLRLGAHWSYNYTVADVAVCPDGVIYGMAWGPSALTNPTALAQSAAITGHLAFYNEPDNCAPGGSCIGASAAAADYPIMETACAPPCRLISAATAYGTSWMVNWWNAHKAQYGKLPRVDILAFHTYTPDDTARLIDYLDLADEWNTQYIAAGSPQRITGVWVTEWCWWQDEAAALDFVSSAITLGQQRGYQTVIMPYRSQIDDPCANYAQYSTWCALFLSCDPTKLTIDGQFWAEIGLPTPTATYTPTPTGPNPLTRIPDENPTPAGTPEP